MIATNSAPPAPENRAFLLLINGAGLLLATLPLLTLLITDHQGLIDLRHCLAAIGLAATLLFLPDVLTEKLPTYGPDWLRYPACLTPVVGAAFVLLGWLPLPAGSGAWLLMGLGLLSLALTNWRIISSLGQRNTVLLAVLLFGLLLFCYLRTYHFGYPFWLFTDALAVGAAHIDTLFHAAIAESIAQLGIPSTSLDGSPLYHYHWGSHLVFGQWARLIGCSSLGFYNLFYPVLAVPLFVKLLWLLYTAVFPEQGAGKTARLAFIPALLLFLLLPLRILQNGHPFLGESNLLALLLVFCHATLILRFVRYPEIASKYFYGLIGISFLFCTIIAFCKISVGFCWTGAIGLLFLLRAPRRYWLAALPAAIVLGLLVLYFIFPAARGLNTATAIKLTVRYINYVGTGGGIFFFLWMPLTLALWWRVHPGPAFRFTTGRRSGIVLVAAFTWLLAQPAALLASANISDVLYFQMVSCLLGLPIWLLLFQDVVSTLPYRRLALLAIGICLACWFTTYQVFTGVPVNARLHAAARATDPTTTARRGLIRQLSDYRSQRRAGDLIFVPPTESWFYLDRELPIKTSFAVPAITGTPLLWGTPDSLLRSDYDYYSLIHYPAAPAPAVRTIAAATEEARRRGANRLIVFRLRNGVLAEERIEL